MTFVKNLAVSNLTSEEVIYHHRSLQNINLLNSYILLLCDNLLRGRGFSDRPVYNNMLISLDVPILHHVKHIPRLLDVQHHWALIPWIVKFMQVSIHVHCTYIYIVVVILFSLFRAFDY